MKLTTLITATLFAALAALAASGIAHANSGSTEGGAGVSTSVGTHIYSPGPMQPAQPSNSKWPCPPPPWPSSIPT